MDALLLYHFRNLILSNLKLSSDLTFSAIFTIKSLLYGMRLSKQITIISIQFTSCKEYVNFGFKYMEIYQAKE